MQQLDKELPDRSLRNPKELRDSLRFWGEVITITVILTAGWVSLSGRVDTQTLRNDRFEREVAELRASHSELEKSIAPVRTDMEVMKTDVRWIRQQMERTQK
jgi:hypothetical protein